MKKKIEDYLPLYFGCQVKVPGQTVTLTGALFADWDFIHWGIKPFLRPLSSMTEDEGREYAQLYGFKGHFPVTITEENGYVKIAIGNNNHGASLFPLGHYGQKPESLRYLLSKHFDLFGLIEDGLALPQMPSSEPNVQASVATEADSKENDD